MVKVNLFCPKMYLEEKLSNNKQEIFEKEQGTFSSRYQYAHSQDGTALEQILACVRIWCMIKVVFMISDKGKTIKNVVTKLMHKNIFHVSENSGVSKNHHREENKIDEKKKDFLDGKR